MRKGREGEKKRGKKEKIDDYSGHYIIASSRLPECRPLERRTLMPKLDIIWCVLGSFQICCQGRVKDMF